MNSGVIIKVEYRVFPENNFSELDAIPFSGKFSEDSSKINAGMQYSFKADFKIAKVEPATDDIIHSITDGKAQFRITDANETKYLVGTPSYPARLYASRNADGLPGSFNGYRCTIKRNAATMSAIEP